MLKIRMRRCGARNAICFRVVLADVRSPRDGKYIESLGYYHPRDPDAKRGLKMDTDRLQYWLDQGAQPSETVVALAKKHYPMVKFK